MRGWASLALVLFLATSCTRTTSASGGPTPVTSATVAPTCSATDTVLQFRGWNGAGGSLQGVVGIANNGKTACGLDGYPALRLRDTDGRELAINATVWETYAKPQAVLLAPGSGTFEDPAAPLRKGQASFAFIWSNWCQSNQTPRLLEVSWPGGLRQVPIAAQTPRCDTPPVVSALQVGPFEEVK